MAVAPMSCSVAALGLMTLYLLWRTMVAYIALRRVRTWLRRRGILHADFRNRHVPEEIVDQLQRQSGGMLRRAVKLLSTVPVRLGHGPSLRAGNGLANLATLISSFSAVPLPEMDLPDPGLVFDLLLASGGRRTQECDGRLSNMCLHMVALVGCDISESGDTVDLSLGQSADPSLDLSPLYGTSHQEQAAMRQFRHGLLRRDCFSSKQALLLPPGVGVLLVMLNRFHNHVASYLAIINERGRFTADHTRDDELFQTARRVTLGLYINLVRHDLLGTLANNSGGSKILPRLDYSRIRRGVTAVSIAHHLQSRLAMREAGWIEAWLSRILRGTDTASVSPEQVSEAISTATASVPTRPEQRTFGGLRRRTDGALGDDALAKMVGDAVGEGAGVGWLGAKRVPFGLRAVEMLAIRRCREQYVPTLNQFRRALGLKPHTEFADINGDRRVSMTLQALYSHPDAVELYAGMMVEEAETGLGLGAGSTADRAFLSHVCAMLPQPGQRTDAGRADGGLTEWGSNLVESQPDISFGGVMHKLLLTSLPNHFEPDSVYAHFPLLIPDASLAMLVSSGQDVLYSSSPPAPRPNPVLVTCAADLDRPPPQPHSLGLPLTATLRSNKLSTYRQCREHVDRLIHSARGDAGDGVDMVSAVCAPAFATTAADLLALPLSKGGGTDGLLTEARLSSLLRDIHAADACHHPAQAFRLNRRAHEAVETIRTHVLATKEDRQPVTSPLLTMLFGRPGRSTDLDHSMCPQIRALAVYLMRLQHAVIEAIDYHLHQGAGHLADLRRHAADADRAAASTAATPAHPDAERLLRYLLEGTRLALARDGLSFHRSSDGTRAPTTVHLTTFSRHPTLFPTPARLCLDRPPTAYRYLGLGDASLCTAPFQAAVAVLAGVLAVRHLAPAAATSLARVTLLPAGPAPLRRDSGVAMPGLQPEPNGWLLIGGGDGDEDEDRMLDEEEDGVEMGGRTVYLTATGVELVPSPASLLLVWDGASSA